jgi:hypothetical protein
MPYSDPERRRDYQREYSRMKRSGGCQTPGQSSIPPEFRLKTAADVVDLLRGQIAAVLAAKTDALTRARTIAYVAGVTLRAIEAGDLAARIEALEAVFKTRNGDGR